MDISQNLLVAMMFVMLISIGIGNILMSLTVLVDRESKLELHWIPLAWLAMIFLIHLRLFWHTLDILAVEDWSFAEFLYIVVGPVFLLLGTTGILPDRAPSRSYEEHYFAVAPRLFTLLALVMVWLVGIDFVFGDGLTANGAWNAFAAVVFAVMAAKPTQAVHTPATWLTIALFVGILGAESLGLT